MVLLMWGRCHTQNAPFQCEEPLRIINVDIYQDSARFQLQLPRAMQFKVGENNHNQFFSNTFLKNLSFFVPFMVLPWIVLHVVSCLKCIAKKCIMFCMFCYMILNSILAPLPWEKKLPTNIILSNPRKGQIFFN